MPEQGGKHDWTFTRRYDPSAQTWTAENLFETRPANDRNIPNYFRNALGQEHAAYFDAVAHEVVRALGEGFRVTYEPGMAVAKDLYQWAARLPAAPTDDQVAEKAKQVVSAIRPPLAGNSD